MELGGVAGRFATFWVTKKRHGVRCYSSCRDLSRNGSMAGIAAGAASLAAIQLDGHSLTWTPTGWRTKSTVAMEAASAAASAGVTGTAVERGAAACMGPGGSWSPPPPTPPYAASVRVPAALALAGQGTVAVAVS